MRGGGSEVHQCYIIRLKIYPHLSRGGLDHLCAHRLHAAYLTDMVTGRIIKQLLRPICKYWSNN